MRIMLDTNVIISALLFPSKRMNDMMDYIFTQHQLVLSSYVVEELKSVVKRKFPAKEYAIEILITGDKDFSDVNIEKPEIITPGEFIEKYI